MKHSKTQWHPAFCSALKLELIANKNDLIYQSEYGINTKPILIDLLVITKSTDVTIQNEIGRFFKGHNLFEYKSPDDVLNIDTFYKGIAYASLYKTTGLSVDSIKDNDITISFVRERKPTKLIKQLKSQNINIKRKGNGIYRIYFNLAFDIQLIVSKELDKNEHKWLTSLQDNLSLEDAKKLIIATSEISEKDEHEYADSVLQVAMSKNALTFEQVKEVDKKMCEALRTLMKPEMDAAIAEAVAEAVAEANAEKDIEIAKKDAEIEQLKALLAAKQ